VHIEKQYTEYMYCKVSETVIKQISNDNKNKRSMQLHHIQEKWLLFSWTRCKHEKNTWGDIMQGRSDGGGYIGIYTLPKSGQVNFYGVKMTS